MLTSFHVFIKLCPGEIKVSSEIVMSIGLPAAAWSQYTSGILVWVIPPGVMVVNGDGRGVEGIWVSFAVGEEGCVWVGFVAVLVCWVVCLAVLVW